VRGEGRPFISWRFRCRSIRKISSAVRKVSSNALAICGAIFDAAHPASELSQLEARSSTPDFWKDQVEAQRILKRRRRLTDDLELRNSLVQKLDDLSVLVEWAEQGEDVGSDLQRALDALEREVEIAEVNTMLAGVTALRLDSAQKGDSHD